VLFCFVTKTDARHCDSRLFPITAAVFCMHAADGVLQLGLHCGMASLSRPGSPSDNLDLYPALDLAILVDAATPHFKLGTTCWPISK
jgi:hypothetical protein